MGRRLMNSWTSRLGGSADKTVFDVVFMQTDDPYFYDLRDRRGPRQPKVELELMLVSDPFDLPPPAYV